ncbi:hypothetical protein [Bradyrhizobium sp. SRS-191]|uniref:hypothetical protein n=1 Tax=Bradyrhizobium sp. SRS-191 TaxID=2962606 RepID=UPI00211E0FC6|nr:hypothetical protein [Bradyrhizobium sp. SRS-191]
MPLTEEAIQVGKCYKTRIAESYKVLSITRGIVTYQTLTSPLRINTGIKAFADAVYKEIRCPEQG